MSEGTWVFLCGVVTGLAVGLVLWFFFRRTLQLDRLQDQLAELEKRWGEGQSRLATQEQTKELERSLQETRALLYGLEKMVENVQTFAQNTLHSEVTKRISEAVQCLSRVEGAVSPLKADFTNIQLSVKTLEDITRKMDQDISRLVGRRGPTGERIVEETLKDLPTTMVRRNVPMGSGEVEFALVLSGDKLVPIDSRAFEDGDPYRLSELNQDSLQEGQGTEGKTQKALKDSLQNLKERVRRKAREIHDRYLTDPRSVGLAILAVPDSVYSFVKFSPDPTIGHKVVIVPYSLLLPQLLSLYLLAERVGLAEAVSDVKGAVSDAFSHLVRGIEALENMQRQITAVANARQKALDCLWEVKRALGRTGHAPAKPLKGDAPEAADETGWQ